MSRKSPVRFPGDAKFAFTILDDTDDSTVENCKPVYDLLTTLGLRTTKTVWALDTAPENQGPYFAGETMARPAYREWVHELARMGFEIAFHNATMGTSTRDDTIAALDYLKSEFGRDVRLHCNHGQNLENLHWGSSRYHLLPLRLALSLWSRLRGHPRFSGESPRSPYYWADVAAERLSYIRAFAFNRLNCDRIAPGRAYRDKRRLDGPVYFNSADAPDVNAFSRLVNRETIDQLEAENGWAIVSTHLGKGFWYDGKLDARFVDSMEYLAARGGWYVPVSELLDFLVQRYGSNELGYLQSRAMELAHFADRLRGRLH
ncbi:MAG: hypothetical protein AAGL69_06885 [Pseudomonadota bacterium]